MDAAKRKPNLLFIYTDEQAYNTLAVYGNHRIQMPNLNAFAKSSTVFDRAYVTQPVCTPSRSSLLTGQWPHTNGCTENNTPLPAGTLCIPEMIGEGGYVTGHFGKWHLGDEIFSQHGFTHWCAIDDGYRNYYSAGQPRDNRSEYYHFLRNHGFEPDNGNAFSRGVTARYPEEYSKPAFLAERTKRFLTEYRDDPFLLFINFFEPHMPYFGPRDHQHKLDDIPLPENFRYPPSDDQPIKAAVYREAYIENGHSGLQLRTESDWRRLIANYWGLCSLVDTYVGKILDTLVELGIFDDTIVVYTSDHGDMMGSHQLTAKCVMYEEAARVPLMIKGQHQEKGTYIDGPVSQIDLAPTLLELLGHDAHEQCQGKSRAELVNNHRRSTGNQDVFLEWQGPNSGTVWEGDPAGPWVPAKMRADLSSARLARHILDPVRTIITADGWKFNMSSLGEHELYNLNDDPGETENRAHRGDYANLMSDLTDRIVEWQRSTKDPALANPGFADPKGW
ncbi:MAG: hypothetical protein CMN78_05130 [Spirochaetales bacterium]|nr:hypothetical protein [Spirochaetales bacterium]